MRHIGLAILPLLAAAAPATAQINAGSIPATADKPFTLTPVATFDTPWRLAFLPDGRLLVTEKPGALWLVTQQGNKVAVTGAPAVEYKGQGGMLGVFVSPKYGSDHSIYLTYAEPGEGGSSLAVMRARLAIGQGTARLEGGSVIWRQLPKGAGGQFGGIIAFAPDKNSMFLTVGERMRFTPAQDPNTELGKVLHLTLDGKPAPGNPMAGKTGTPTVALFTPPKNTAAAADVKGDAVTLPGPNLAPAETWASGIRTPYGLAFDGSGHLWEVEHGPRGGDELNLVEPGRNFGWPLVSYGQNYDGVPIPKPDTRPDLTQPVIYWNPVIAPGGFAFYQGRLFPQWRGSAFITGLSSKSLSRVTFDGKGGATPAEKWDMGQRMRDVAVGPDGALWLIEDDKQGRLLRLTPKK